MSSTAGRSRKNVTAIIPHEVSIERDPTTGAITRILSSEGAEQRQDPRDTASSRPSIGGKKSTFSRSGFSEWEPTPSSEDDEALPGESDATAGTVVGELVRQANVKHGVSKRKQSAREIEWLERLVARYGDDCARMARDMKLNPMQQSEGDIRRRIRRWKEGS